MSMSTQERGILIGLAIVLAVGTALIVIKAKQGQDERDGSADASSSGGGFDDRRLPELESQVREFNTPGGVRVVVIREGTGEPVGKGQSIDVAYTGYHAASGAVFERDTFKGLVLSHGGAIAGWIEGLAGIRPHEQRRLYIPSALAYGKRGNGNIRPDSDLVFDVEWVRLETEDLRVGTGKLAKRGSRVLADYRGEFEDGRVFDASADHTPPEPMWFTLRRGKVIDGFALGISGMKAGGIRRIRVPYHLGYGTSGGQGIPGHANLIFTVELRDVE